MNTFRKRVAVLRSHTSQDTLVMHALVYTLAALLICGNVAAQPDLIGFLSAEGLEFIKNTTVRFARFSLVHNEEIKQWISGIILGDPNGANARNVTITALSIAENVCKIRLSPYMIGVDAYIPQLGIQMRYRLSNATSEDLTLNVSRIEAWLRCNVSVTNDNLVPRITAKPACILRMGPPSYAGSTGAIISLLAKATPVKKLVEDEVVSGLFQPVVELMIFTKDAMLKDLQNNLTVFNISLVNNVTVHFQQAGERSGNSSNFRVPINLVLKRNGIDLTANSTFDPHNFCPKPPGLGTINGSGEGKMADALSFNCKQKVCLAAVFGIGKKFDPSVATAKDLELTIDGDTANARALCESTFNASERSVHVKLPLSISCRMRYQNESQEATPIFQISMETAIDVRGISSNETHIFLQPAKNAAELSLKFINGTKLYHRTHRNYTIKEKIETLFEMATEHVEYELLGKTFGDGIPLNSTGIPGLAIAPEFLDPDPQKVDSRQDDSYLAVGLRFEFDVEAFSNITRQDMTCKKYSLAACVREKHCDETTTCEGPGCFQRTDYVMTNGYLEDINEQAFGCMTLADKPLSGNECRKVNETTSAAGGDTWSIMCACDQPRKCNDRWNQTLALQFEPSIFDKVFFGIQDVGR